VPHYADGTPAAVGDKVRGTVYNNPGEIEGVIVAITSEGEACNCKVVFSKLIEDYTAVKDLTKV
jgi:hypothetical protein